MPGDAGKHGGAYLVAVAEGEHEIGPAIPGQRAMGAGLTLRA